MTAKEMFEQLGYKQEIFPSPHSELQDMQYVKKDDESEMNRVGMIRTKYIEFYADSKEVVICTRTEFRRGHTSESDCGILKLEEFNAVQQQIAELKWNEKE